MGNMEKTEKHLTTPALVGCWKNEDKKFNINILKKKKEGIHIITTTIKHPIPDGSLYQEQDTD